MTSAAKLDQQCIVDQMLPLCAYRATEKFMMPICSEIEPVIYQGASHRGSQKVFDFSNISGLNTETQTRLRVPATVL